MLAVKGGGREGFREVHQKFTLMGERRTHTHTQAGPLLHTF